MWSKEKAAEEDDMIWLDLIWMIPQQSLKIKRETESERGWWEISWFDLMPWFDALIDCWFGGAWSRICCFFFYLGMGMGGDGKGMGCFLGKKEMKEEIEGIEQDAQWMVAIEKIYRTEAI